jgi:hypothetical protein
MNNKVLVIGALILLILGGVWFKGCHPNNVINKPVIIPTAVSTPTAAQLHEMPGAVEAVSVPTAVPHLGYTTTTTVLIGKSGTAETIITPKIAWGIKNAYGLYLDVGLDGFGGGLKWTPVYYWRLNLDALVGYPTLGAGLSYQVYNNTYAGISYGYDYTKILAQPGLYVSLNF